MIKPVAVSIITLASLLVPHALAAGHAPSSRGAVQQAVDAAYAELDAATSIVVVRFSETTYATSRTEDVFGEGEDPDLVTLRLRVASNAQAVAALDAAGLAAEHVVAMKATHDGTVYLYINDLEEAGSPGKTQSWKIR